MGLFPLVQVLNLPGHRGPKIVEDLCKHYPSVIQQEDGPFLPHESQVLFLSESLPDPHPDSPTLRGTRTEASTPLSTTTSTPLS